MNSPNFEGSGDSEPWDGKGELEWTERNWKEFLKEADAEVGKFIKIYQSLKDVPNRLDHTALGMGWDSEEWSVELKDEDAGRSEWYFELSDEDDYDEIDDDDPYTIHKHPLYITTKSLHSIMVYCWKIVLMDRGEALRAQDSFEFGESVREAETNAIMGIHALEMGDYNLVVVHLQRSMAALNKTMNCFLGLENRSIELVPSIKDNFQSAFFDLREVWLRVIRDCRGTFDSK